MDLIKLEYRHYDNEDFCDQIVCFSVTKKWFKNYTGLSTENQIDMFLEDCTSEDTEQVYFDAMIQDVLVQEVIKYFN